MLLPNCETILARDGDRDTKLFPRSSLLRTIAYGESDYIRTPVKKQTDEIDVDVIVDWLPCIVFENL